MRSFFLHCRGHRIAKQCACHSGVPLAKLVTTAAQQAFCGSILRGIDPRHKIAGAVKPHHQLRDTAQRKPGFQLGQQATCHPGPLRAGRRAKCQQPAGTLLQPAFIIGYPAHNAHGKTKQAARRFVQQKQ
ncbi:hypothetical protein SDC9_202961 [bioreactor metagenome]|uniref:Uncharacterized protein n=1 Tax=bioreactor metagenome TaxID=1076179 RepID=A0A645IWM5_9ZZZZ